ncbi:MAG TPA: FHA domain-containing serine/threonine-protein kinase [Gemmataceae bacterium]|nr:FHA domain-containing serine/threonine-protein kinase [Gemmataceae bacterium]
MLAQLRVVTGPDQGRVFLLEKSLVIGRGQETDTRLKDPQVSRVHCRINVDGDKSVLVHSSKTSDTLVNGQRAAHHELKPGDTIQIGSTQMRFELEGTPEASTLMMSSTPTKPTASKTEKLAELVGQTLSHFVIDTILARGQAGMIFRARDTQNDNELALKVLWPEFARNDDEMQRFVRAMKTMLPIRHPNLVALYGAGKTSSYCWIAMEYVAGESLTAVIERIGTAGMLDWRNALRVGVHVARGLAFAQQHHIIHRNIKPSNILIRESDKLTKLGDLMLAKALEGTLAEQITRPGELVGDIAYMSPERTYGGSANVDGRSDIYSLGATVYALLTGRPPFSTVSLAQTIQQIRNEEPVKPKKFQLAVPDLFEGTVLKMLAKRPEDRFQTAAELSAELERVGKFQGLSF